MLSRKPALALWSCSTLPPHCSSVSCASSSLHARHTRRYAQHAARDDVDSSWPEAIPPHSIPTPYQILSLQRDDVYSKHRFYSLVKLYHPDHCHPSSPVAQLPPAVRLERYRLLITAHAILSDDAKRKAYDLWGHGWVGYHRPTSSPSRSRYGPTPAPRHWQPGNDPMYNATWEDWERWYQREYGRPRDEDVRAMYAANFGFMSVMFALVSIGAIMQGSRAGIMTSSVMERRDQVHKEASMELRRAQRASMSGGDRNERIKTFMAHREVSRAGDDAYQRLLPPSDSCIPDTVRKQE
ncbi:hypothetical protein EJ04DRAFT_509735 [Polyplosphaeria fusca]|uniref:J domain-containing protein n=1 Tax=Polyplosphaeria fusca TaxID=682080 RepID=A0A9P4R2S9_9PLEO|nr:hypothetical protein EJ04DRAFT_509735 [Polyplosphaeria fusca]